MSPGSMMSRMLRDRYESLAGRINATAGGWLFDPPQALIEKTRQKNPNLFIGGRLAVLREDADGRQMVLTCQRTVLCPMEEGRQGVYPRAKNERAPEKRRWYYPEALCKKCEHREKASRKFRFPRCLLRASKEPGKDALKEVFGCVQDAVNETQKIMGR